MNILAKFFISNDYPSISIEHLLCSRHFWVLEIATTKTKMSHLSKSLHLHVSVYVWGLEGGKKYIGKYEGKILDSDNCWVVTKNKVT